MPKIGYKRVKSWTSGVEPPQDASVQIKQESIFFIMHILFLSSHEHPESKVPQSPFLLAKDKCRLVLTYDQSHNVISSTCGCCKRNE